jgi:hypothetical protein
MKVQESIWNRYTRNILETNWEYPKEIEDFPKIVSSMMEASAAKYCKSLPIPAEASVGTCWIH